jgi:hypothetical protein
MNLKKEKKYKENLCRTYENTKKHEGVTRG